MRDKSSGKSRGFAFVTFQEEEAISETTTIGTIMITEEVVLTIKAGSLSLAKIISVMEPE